MTELNEDPLAPDWGEIDKGNKRAVSDALFVIWALLHPSINVNAFLGAVGGTDTQILFNDGGIEGGATNLRYAKATGYVSLGPNNAGGPLRISSNNGNLRHIVIEVADDTANHLPRFDYLRARGLVTDAPKTIVNASDLIGLIAFSGWDGSTYIPAAYIDCLVDGTPGSNDMPGRLRFHTTPDGASAPVSQLEIDNAGLVTGKAVSLLGPGTILTGTTTNPTPISIESTHANGGQFLWKTSGTIIGYQGSAKQVLGAAYSNQDFCFLAGENLVLGASLNVGGKKTIITSAVQMSNFGAGTATFDANGNVSSVSDERLKQIQGSFTAGLAELLSIHPILYSWQRSSGLDTENVYAGFSAQNVLAYIPEAIGKGPEGFYTFNDRPVLAAVVNAIQTLSRELDDMRAALSLASVPHPARRHNGEDRIVRSRPHQRL